MEAAGVRLPLKALNLDANATRAPARKAGAASASTGQNLDHDKAVPGGRQKPRLSQADIDLILALKSEPCPTPEDSKRVALAGRIDAMWREFRDDVVEQLSTKGYVEVEEGYFAERARSEAWVRDKWATLDFSKFDLYRPGDEGLDDFVVRPGDEEAIYYGDEE